MPQHDITVESCSGRVRLTPPDPELDEIVALHRTHPETLKHLRVLVDKMTAKEVRLRREKRRDDLTIFDFYAFTVNEDGSRGELVGTTGVFRIEENNNTCGIGILVAPGKHKEGYGTEILYCVMKWIFEEKKLHRGTFETAVDNVPMQRWFEKTGIRFEGLRKEAWRGLKSGEYEDARSYAVLEWEWRDRVKANLEDRIRKRWGLQSNHS